MTRPKRKFSKFQLTEPDCRAQIGEVVIKVYKLTTEKPKIEYNVKRKDVSATLKTAVKVWVKHKKFGGLSLQEFLEQVLF